MSKIEKRYQRFTRNGIKWSSWFTCDVRGKDITSLEPWQLDHKLKNEYREVDDNGNVTPIKISYKASKKVETKKK